MQARNNVPTRLQIPPGRLAICLRGKISDLRGDLLLAGAKRKGMACQWAFYYRLAAQPSRTPRQFLPSAWGHQTAKSNDDWFRYLNRRYPNLAVVLPLPLCAPKPEKR